MSSVNKMEFRHEEDGLHFSRGREEFLTLLHSGEVIVRSRLRDGSLHIHSEQWPKLLPWIYSQLRSSDDNFWVGIHRLPKKTHRRIRIRSVITLFIIDDTEYPVVFTREPLDEHGVKELLLRLPPFLALINAGQVYFNNSASYARPRLE